MHFIHPDLGLTQVDAHLREAQQRRRQHQLARVLRSERKAERLAQQARLAIARTI